MIGDGQLDGVLCGAGTVCKPVPTEANVTGALEVMMAAQVAIARLADGRLVAWGGDIGGELGIGVIQGMQLSPGVVLGFP
jgi:hypothetical protein